MQVDQGHGCWNVKFKIIRDELFHDPICQQYKNLYSVLTDQSDKSYTTAAKQVYIYIRYFNPMSNKPCFTDFQIFKNNQLFNMSF